MFHLHHNLWHIHSITRITVPNSIRLLRQLALTITSNWYDRQRECENVVYCERNSNYLSSLKLKSDCVSKNNYHHHRWPICKGKKTVKYLFLVHSLLESQSHGWSRSNLTWMEYKLSHGKKEQRLCLGM